MASKKGRIITEFTHWKRPRSRMYDYNYQFASSYYRPQVNYIGETFDANTRRNRRKTVSPPRARTFVERWAAEPFYGRHETISEFQAKHAPGMAGSRLVRASSYPAGGIKDGGEQEEDGYQMLKFRGSSMSRARSATRETSVFARGQSVVRCASRARSETRARSVFQGQENNDDSRSVRENSCYHYDEFTPLSDAEWERLLKYASKEERERSIFQLRMGLENPRDLPKKSMMQTTVGLGFYQNSLYGNFTWDPAR